jgi:hypothetical protein
MKLSTIERNPDTKQLEVVFSFNDNITISIPIIDEKTTVSMIKSTAESLGLNPDSFISKYKALYAELAMYSKYRSEMLRKHKILSAQYNDIFFTLVCGGVLSMSEIYWFDWYIKKHGLAKVNG